MLFQFAHVIWRHFWEDSIILREKVEPKKAKLAGDNVVRIPSLQTLIIPIRNPADRYLCHKEFQKNSRLSKTTQEFANFKNSDQKSNLLSNNSWLKYRDGTKL